MKSLIKYYFNFDIANIRLINNDYYFLYNGIEYVFLCVDIEKYDMNNIFRFNMQLLNYNSLFHQIILNKDNMITTIVGNNHYVLLKININGNKQIGINDILNFMIPISMENKLLSNANQFDWINLWRSKIDYFEYYTNSIDTKNIFLNELINYYIGLGENAISYIEDTLVNFKVSNLVVSHRRIDCNYTLLDLYNPLNVTIDHVTRDISEYFKSLFINKKYDLNDLDRYFSMFIFAEGEYRLLFGRMLFPSFFFDNYELYVKNKLEEKKMLDIVNRVGEYEKFLKKMYLLISEKYSIPEVRWLKKVDIWL